MHATEPGQNRSNQPCLVSRTASRHWWTSQRSSVQNVVSIDIICLQPQPCDASSKLRYAHSPKHRRSHSEACGAHPKRARAKNMKKSIGFSEQVIYCWLFFSIKDTKDVICPTTDEIIDRFAATAARRLDFILWHGVCSWFMACNSYK